MGRIVQPDERPAMGGASNNFERLAYFGPGTPIRVVALVLGRTPTPNDATADVHARTRRLRGTRDPASADDSRVCDHEFGLPSQLLRSRVQPKSGPGCMNSRPRSA